MSLEVCQLHNLLKDYICASNDDNQLVCRQCFIQSSQKSTHPSAVKLSLQTKEFFLQWTEYVLKKLVEFKETVTQMGYSKVFEMKLDPNHPQGMVNELDFKEIQKIALQALQEHRSVTEGNLTFIQGTTTIIEMTHPQFLKDLWNIVCKDTKFNLSHMLSTFKTKLVQAYPSKEIYQYANFTIVEKEMEEMEQKRVKLLQEFESKIVLWRKDNELTKQVDNQMEKNQLPPSHHSLTLQISTQSVPAVQQQSSQPQQDNISTISNPSSTSKQVKQVEFSQREITDTVSETNTDQQQTYEQLTTAIAFLKQNELMYQQKLIKLQQKNILLKSQVERLSISDARVKELQEQLKAKQVNAQNIETPKPQSLQKVSIELSNELQSALKSQIQQLTKTQVNLIQENANINKALKDLEDIAQGRSRTINDLQSEIKTLTESIQLKQRSIQQLNQLISNEEEEISYRENEVEILGEEIKKKLERIESLQKSVQEYNKLVANKEEEVSCKEQQVSNLNEQITKLKTRNSELQNSIKSLNNLITNQEQELSYRQNQVDVLEKQIKNLIGKVELLEKAVPQLKEIIAKKQQEISQKENKVEILGEEIKKKQERIEFLQKFVEEHIKLVAKKDEEISYKEQQVVNLNEQITKLKTRTSEMQKSIKSLNNLITNQEEELSNRQNQVDILEKQIKKLIGKVELLEKAVLQLNDIIAKKQQQITQKENEVGALNEQVKKILESNQNLNEQANQITDKKAQLQAQVNELSAQLLVSNQYEEKSKLLQNQLNLINQQNILLTDQVNILKEKHLLAEEDLNKQVKNNAKLQGEVKEAKHASSLLETEVNILKADLLNVRAENIMLQQKINFPTALFAQVVQLESDNRLKSEDNKILAQIVMKYNTLIPPQQSLLIKKTLNELKTFELH